METFAIYQGATVLVQEWQGAQVLVSFKDGTEKYVGAQEIDIVE